MEIILIIVLIWGVLNIILFFKIWNMTDDVCKIKNILLGGFTTSTKHEDKANQPTDTSFTISPNINDENYSSDESELKVGDRVHHFFYSRDRKMFIKEIYEDETCLCVDEDGNKIDIYKLSNLSRI